MRSRSQKNGTINFIEYSHLHRPSARQHPLPPPREHDCRQRPRNRGAPPQRHGGLQAGRQQHQRRRRRSGRRHRVVLAVTVVCLKEGTRPEVVSPAHDVVQRGLSNGVDVMRGFGVQVFLKPEGTTKKGFHRRAGGGGGGVKLSREVSGTVTGAPLLLLLLYRYKASSANGTRGLKCYQPRRPRSRIQRYKGSRVCPCVRQISKSPTLLPSRLLPAWVKPIYRRSHGANSFRPYLPPCDAIPLL